MTIIVRHRINTISNLLETPTRFGVEIDLRSNHQDIILCHDPFSKNSVNFRDWLQHFDHRLLILNVKEEGLEKHITQILKKLSINNYFFLDQSFPFLIKTSSNGETRSAVRFSEYESIDTVISLKNKINWVWVDYFTKFPLSVEQYQSLQSMNYKVCLVSPELQGYSPEIMKSLISNLNSWKISVDAVCTKHPELWEALYNQ